MLKQFVAAFLLLTFMAQTFSNAIVVADYYTNTTSFAAKCENKDKPQMHCNGQCQMVKKLEKETNSSKPFNNASKEKNELQLFCYNDLTTEASLPSVVSIFQYNPFQFAMQQCIRTFFHPPSVA
ncbi:hypothetical protein FRZ67_20925 [Panacibacter ginsenosidivorans]|uniref:Transmembrane protein n=1 Tax=Panacibacter ginsenosidivorans TaxID=1813871 RepID=A0A5B8VEY9_9BACT|nr:hypothetical protein [Panacibacter ginsenosidivorans]QEC69645.1 hypothetical protein FRZ67_20925 [Panacibacter ginsenosidivorans]